MSTISRDLYITHYRLSFGSTAPIRETYDYFEEKEEYPYFKIHFKELFEEWEKLKKRAIKHNEQLTQFFQQHKDENALKKANDELKPLQEDFNDFAKRLSEKMYDIDRYRKIGKGKDFWYNKMCPKCEDIFSQGT